MAIQHRVHLSDDDRSKLNAIIKSGTALARMQTKARILLLTDRNCANRLTDDQIIAVLRTSNSNIQRTRISFLANGLEGCLKDKPRSGRKPRITGDVEAKLTLLACSKPPEGQCKWTLTLLAQQMVELGYTNAISRVAVHNHLKKTNSNPGLLIAGA
jgi:hypothetical protein